jgi:hypothetical protein
MSLLSNQSLECALGHRSSLKSRQFAPLRFVDFSGYSLGNDVSRFSLSVFQLELRSKLHWIPKINYTFDLRFACRCCCTFWLSGALSADTSSLTLRVEQLTISERTTFLFVINYAKKDLCFCYSFWAIMSWKRRFCTFEGTLNPVRDLDCVPFCIRLVEAWRAALLPTTIPGSSATKSTLFQQWQRVYPFCASSSRHRILQMGCSPAARVPAAESGQVTFIQIHLATRRCSFCIELESHSQRTLLILWSQLIKSMSHGLHDQQSLCQVMPDELFRTEFHNQYDFNFDG